MLLQFLVQFSMQTVGNDAWHEDRCLYSISLCAGKQKKGRQISAQASPDPEYDSLIFTKMRATHLSKTSRGGQTWSSSRMDRERRQVGPWAEVQVHYNS